MRLSALLALLILIGGCKSRSFHLASDEGEAFERTEVPDVLMGFIRQMEAKNPRSVADVFPHLPEAWRRYAMLGHSPRGTHTGSLDYPRVIVPNEDASLILSFSPLQESKRKGGSDIEVIALDQPLSYGFFTLSFEANALSVKSGGRPCLACHASKMPIWDSYGTWPDFYGTDHNRYTLLSEAEKKEDPELLALNRFIAKQKDHPIYSAIPFLFERDALDTLEERNDIFGQHIYGRYVGRIAMKIVDHPTWQQQKRAYLAAFLISEFKWLDYVDPLKREKLKAYYQDEAATIERELEQYETYRRGRIAKNIGLSLRGYSDERRKAVNETEQYAGTIRKMAAVRALMKDAGITFGPWTLAVAAEEPARAAFFPSSLEDGRTAFDCLTRYFQTHWTRIDYSKQALCSPKLPEARLSTSEINTLLSTR